MRAYRGVKGSGITGSCLWKQCNPFDSVGSFDSFGSKRAVIFSISGIKLTNGNSGVQQKQSEIWKYTFLTPTIAPLVLLSFLSMVEHVIHGQCLYSRRPSRAPAGHVEHTAYSSACVGRHSDLTVLTEGSAAYARFVCAKDSTKNSNFCEDEVRPRWINSIDGRPQNGRTCYIEIFHLNRCWTPPKIT